MRIKFIVQGELMTIVIFADSELAVGGYAAQEYVLKKGFSIGKIISIKKWTKDGSPNGTARKTRNPKVREGTADVPKVPFEFSFDLQS